MKKRGFTLVELLAVIVVLAIILAIAVPNIAGIIRSSTRSSFESDAKLVLKAIDYAKLANNDFDIDSVNRDSVANTLKLSNDNYDSVNVVVEENVPIITIVGKNKWSGLVACGTYRNMRVVESTTDCTNDLISPILNIIGDSIVYINVFESYSDQGAVATDNKDGDITDNIEITGIINPNIPGTYTITYSVRDSAGNVASTTRIINVIDNVDPVISFDPIGYTSYSKIRSIGVTVTDEGGVDTNSLKYVWTMSIDEPLTSEFVSSFVIGNSINTPNGVTGSYYLWIRASDEAGNVVISKSDVVNLDNIAPIITINGNSSITITKGSTYSDQGATATDNIDTSLTVLSNGLVNPSIVGTYTITYSASDEAGNSAIEVIRTINVVDASAPVITVLGSNPVSVNIGVDYVDAGSTALDDVDGDVTSSITVTGSVNKNIPGTYIITYKAHDSANNESIATRTVNVIDNVNPTVTFGTNGNIVYAKSRSTTVTVSDNVAINNLSLKYQWTTSTVSPTETSFTAGFTNGSSINTPTLVNGGYYLWILGKDSSGNTIISRSNIFNLDNTAPTATFSSDYLVNINTEITSSFLKSITTVSDNYTAVNEIVINNIVIKNSLDSAVATTLSGYDVYTVTYGVVDTSGNSLNVTRNITTKPVTSVTLTNILSDPSYESGIDYWYNLNTSGGYSSATRVTERSYAGSYSYRVYCEVSQAWPRADFNSNNITNKTMYSRVYTYKTQNDLFPGLYFLQSETTASWPNNSISFYDYGYTHDVDTLNQWFTLSVLAPTSPYQYFKIMLPQTNANGTGYIWYDGLMVVDLSIPFDSNTPTKKWMDRMIPYFEGNRTFSW